MNTKKMYFDLYVASFKQLSSFNIHYNGATINEAHFIWQKTHIQPAMAGCKITTMLHPLEIQFSTYMEFILRYCMRFYLNLHRNRKISKSELLNSLYKIWPFVIAVPLEAEADTAPHYKAETNATLHL